MQTRIIPSSGAVLPAIGCGTWIGFDVGARPAELPQRAAVLAQRWDAAGRVIDSSPMYGSAEQVVGQLLQAKGSRKNQLLLKFVPSQPAITCDRIPLSPILMSFSS